MENLRKRVDVRLATDEKQLLKLSSKPTFVSSKIFHKNLVAIHRIKETLKLDKPAFIGMCILDLSNTLINDFIIIISKISMVKKQDYYSRIQTTFLER